MARSVVVRVTCDICGVDVAEGNETRFSLGTSTFSADLCEADRQALADALQPYVTVAQPVSGRAARTTALPAAPRRNKPARRDPEQVDAIRQWARAHGYTVSDRGRIPHEVEAAYNKKS
jgi:hypothetical protein